MDLSDEDGGPIQPVEIRGDVNGELLPENLAPLLTMEYDAVQHWSVAGTEAHPTHLHVQHFQLQDDNPQVSSTSFFKL